LQQGVNRRRHAENCIKDAGRIVVVRAIAGDTAKLASMGMRVSADGRLVLLGDDAEQGGKRAREGGVVDAELLQLLRAWQLAPVADILVAEGVTDVRVLREELSPPVIEGLPVGVVFKNRLGALVKAVLATHDLQEQQSAAALRTLEQLRVAPPGGGAEPIATLADVAMGSAAVLGALVAHDGVGVLIAVMAAHLEAPEVQRSAFVLVARLAVSRHHGALVAAGGSAAVLCGMAAHGEHVGVQARGVAALRLLVFDFDSVLHLENLAVVATATGVGTVLAAMRTHKDAAALQEDACAVLCELARVPGAKEAMLCGGGVRAVLAAMTAHGARDPLLYEACRALARMLAPASTQSPALASTQTPAPASTQSPAPAPTQSPAPAPTPTQSPAPAPTQSPAPAPTQSPAPAPTQSPAPESTQTPVPAPTPARDGEMHAEAVPVLLAAMVARVGNVKLLAVCCNVLYMLCKRDTRCRDALQTAGGVAVLLAAMEAHAGGMGDGILVLGTLCYTEGSRSAVVAGGAVRVMLAAMQAHAQNARVLAHCALCLCNIAQCHSHRTLIVLGAGVEVVLASMRAHTGDAGLQEHACGALVNVVSNSAEARAAVVLAGGIRGALDAMLSHPRRERMQEVGCMLLRALSALPEHQRAIAREGGIPAILAAMAAHRAACNVQEHACVALTNVMANSEPSQQEVSAAGGAVCILGAMQAHPASRDVTQRACLALRFLVDLARNQSAMADAGGIRALLTAMTLHSADSSVREPACVVLCGIGWADALLQVRIKHAGGSAVLARVLAHEGVHARCRELGQGLQDRLSRV